MVLEMLKLIILAFLMLAGCAAAPVKDVLSLNPNSIQSLEKQASEDLGSTQVGESVTVEGVKYTVVESYRAASGRNCKKLLANGLSALRVVCQADSGAWYLRKSLTSRSTDNNNAMGFNTLVPTIPSSTAVALPSSSPYSTVLRSDDSEQVAVESELMVEDARDNDFQVRDVSTEDPKVTAQRTFAMLPDENLWRFSKRLTGNAINWQKIARYNQIGNVAGLRTGDRLVIPADMYLRKDGG